MKGPILFVVLASTPSVHIDTPPLRLGRLGFVFVPHHRPASAASVRLLRSPQLANRNGSGLIQSPSIKHNKSVFKAIETARKISSAVAVLKARDGVVRPHNEPGKLRRCSQHGQLLEHWYLPLSIILPPSLFYNP
jgi:hypothetical protein